MPHLTLIIMRHAKALAAGASGGDFTRPLAPRGRVDAARMGRWLYARYPDIDRVLVSPAQRTRETLAGVLAAWPDAAPTVIWDPSIYLAELSSLLRAVAAHATGKVLVLGHNPGMEELLRQGLGEASAELACELMPTAAVYVLGLAAGGGSLAVAGRAALLDHMRPTLLVDPA
ncbi:MAG: histidine phosphatase family protein [Gammaproteobacteria bacterium]|nr:histidine phosphatase family protein [Gammaproteobacteria bacterium]